MTLNTMGRRAVTASIASILSLAMGLGLTACSSDYTVGYVYATTSQANPGLISGYKVDYQSGTLTFLADSPIPSGGKNPVTIVAAPSGKALYAIHRDDSTVVFFAIGTDGKLYAQHTYNASGSFPTAAAIDAAGKFLYVTFTYQNCTSTSQGCIVGDQLYTPANPGPGGVSIFAIAADGSLGTPTTVNVGRNPVGIIANSKSRNVYVIEQDAATTSNLLGFSANATTGMLTPLPGVTINPGNVASLGFPTGVTPSGIIEDSASTHLYITDQTANTVTGYSVASNGVPSLLANGTAKTDAGPLGMSFDLSGKYLYVANYTGGTISGFTFGSNGEPVPSTVAKSVQAGTGTTCVTVIGAPTNTSPTHAIYLYTSNALSNTVSGLQLNPTDGSLRQIQNTPFTASALPTCIVSVAMIPR
jgi:6-phosphogluconolactonase (cycloisomerase 2 family)